MFILNLNVNIPCNISRLVETCNDGYTVRVGSMWLRLYAGVSL